MNLALTITLVVLVLLFARCSYVMFRRVESWEKHRLDPEELTGILDGMLWKVEHAADWERLEDMRDHLRRGLARVSELRHDVGRVELRSTKRA